MEDYVNIPQELRSENRWVVWKKEKRNGKWTKVPYDAKTGDFAKSNDAGTQQPRL
jgi:putative DNA primase/helicase